MSILISKELEGNIDIENIINEENKKAYITINHKKINCEFVKSVFKKNKIQLELSTKLNFFDIILTAQYFDFCFNKVVIKNILSSNIKFIEQFENKIKFMFVINKNKYLINDEVKNDKN